MSVYTAVFKKIVVLSHRLNANVCIILSSLVRVLVLFLVLVLVPVLPRVRVRW